MGPKKFCVNKNFWPKNFWAQKEMSPQNLLKKNFWSKKIFGLKNFLVCKVVWVQQKLLVHKFLALNNFGSKKFGSKDVVSKNILVHKNYDPQKIGFKIGPATAEIMMIWTNVARTYMLPRQSHHDSWHLLKIVPWDILDMDICHRGKCCLDKCHGDSCNLLYMSPGPFV